jgi:hypothetical protein
MFVVFRMGISEEQGARMNNIGGDSLPSGVAWPSDDGGTEGPVKGRLSNVG